MDIMGCNLMGGARLSGLSKEQLVLSLMDFSEAFWLVVLQLCVLKCMQRFWGVSHRLGVLSADACAID